MSIDHLKKTIKSLLSHTQHLNTSLNMIFHGKNITLKLFLGFGSIFYFMYIISHVYTYINYTTLPSQFFVIFFFPLHTLLQQLTFSITHCS
eukprot:UN00449